MNRSAALCMGYGGLELAVEQVFGLTPAWCAEFDDAPSAVIDQHWPGLPNYRDITAIDWSLCEPVELVTAGYPCQPFSHAGKREGTDDARHLWPYIAECLRVLRPRLAVFENVAGHLSLGFDTVLADLAELGFDVEWVVVRASDVGACHQRARLFILAADAERIEGRERHDADLLGRRAGATQQAWMGSVVATDSSGERGRWNPGTAPRTQEPVGRREPNEGDRAVAVREDAAHPDRMARASGRTLEGRPGPLDEPSQIERVERLRGVPAAHADDGADDRERPRPTPGRRDQASPNTYGEGLEGREPAPGRDVPAWGGSWGDYGPAIDRHARVLGRPAPAPVDEKGRLSPLFVEWMMMLPEGWVCDVPGLSRAKQLKLLGNGVVPLQAAYAITHLLGRLTEREAAA